MYKTRKELKAESRKAMAGKWGTAAAMSLVITFINLTFTSEWNNFFFAITFPPLGAILNQILLVGFYSFFLKLLCGQKKQANYMDLFYGFKCHPGKIILLNLLTILYMLPGILIYTICVFVFVFMIYVNAGVSMDLMLQGAVPENIPLLIASFLIVSVLSILFFIYALYISSTYSMVYLLLLDYPDMPVTDIWHSSARLMKGQRMRYIGLELSFIPWILLCIATLGIGMLWLMPYMNASITAFYLDLVTHKTTAKNKTQNTVSDTNMTHDCETDHPNTRSEDGNDYSGIDRGTFL